MVFAEGTPNEHFQICEVYYDDDWKPTSHAYPVAAYGETFVGLSWEVDKYKEALTKPILSHANWPNEYGKNK